MENSKQITVSEMSHSAVPTSVTVTVTPAIATSAHTTLSTASQDFTNASTVLYDSHAASFRPIGQNDSETEVVFTARQTTTDHIVSDSADSMHMQKLYDKLNTQRDSPTDISDCRETDHSSRNSTPSQTEMQGYKHYQEPNTPQTTDPITHNSTQLTDVTLIANPMTNMTPKGGDEPPENTAPIPFYD